MPALKTVPIFASNEKLRQLAVSMAKRLTTKLVNSSHEVSTAPLVLVITDHAQAEYQWELHFPTEKLAPVFVDFDNEQLRYRLKFGGGRQQTIARAMGLKKLRSPLIVDATAGLGRDAFILSSLGCQVQMLERNPVIHVLLEDGLRRHAMTTGRNQSAGDLQLTHSDSVVWLKTNRQPVDIIYLDPMYPQRNKSALVKKEMRILRQLVGDDLDIDVLLNTALGVARQRVVVKRPKAAPPIASIAPSHCIESKNTRYDIYITGRLGDANAL